MMPPTVSVLAETVTTRLPTKVTLPVPRLSVFVPTNVKSWFQCWALLLEVARAAVTSMVTAVEPVVSPISNTPAAPPNAASLPKISLPVLRLTPPVKVLALESVVAPLLVLLINNATFPPPAPFPMMPLSVIPPEFVEVTVSVCVPADAAPVMAPTVSRAVPLFEMESAVEPAFRMTAVLMVPAPLPV